MDNTESVVRMCESFKLDIQRCVQCPVVLECAYPKKRLQPLRDEAQKMAENIYQEELELDNSAENVLRAQEKRDRSFNTHIINNSIKILQNDRCIYERDEILKTLQSFSDSGYNIGDPRVYMIIKELISNILISGRANKAFSNLGVIMKRETPGGPVYYANPLLKHKFEFSRLISEATESLDRILKSDIQQSLDKSFTAHLLAQLKEKPKLAVKEDFEHRSQETLEIENDTGSGTIREI